ncbi:hypothetical protein EDB83DRAFT_2586759 [Lactarius deliciosus]|nr:hypothetical protein EDB83DRAFT_2586759 [Lactarius deliciosus]
MASSRSPSEIDDEHNLDSVLNSSEPAIDLNLPAFKFETSVANFLRAIANFTARSIAKITQRQDVHDKELKRLEDRAQDVEKETEQCKLKKIEHIARRSLHHAPSRLFPQIAKSLHHVLKRELEREETEEGWHPAKPGRGDPIKMCIDCRVLTGRKLLQQLCTKR